MRIPAKESLYIEFKSERSGPIEDSVIINNVVAFANTGGGTLYLGVEDDGTPTGVSKRHQDITQLCAFVFNHTVPPMQVRATAINVDADKGGPTVRVIAIAVDESSQLVCTKDGRVLHRVLKADGEPEVITMYPYEYMSRLSSIGQYDYSDQPAPDSSPDDLDPNARALLREGIARTHSDDQILGLGDKAFDGALRLVTARNADGKTTPTVTGLLAIGTKRALRRSMPTATATFQVMRGGSPVVDETLRLPLASMFQRVEQLLEPWNHQSEVMVGLQHANFYDYDHSAFREAMLNAFCHRDYTRMSPVRFQLDEVGLTIASPGGFVRGVQLDNLLTVSPTPRNQRLADVLKRCGYVERTGRGIDRIFTRTVASGRPLPDYSQSTADEVVLFLRKAPIDAQFVRMVNDLTTSRGANLPAETLIALAAIHQYGQLDADGLRRSTSLDRERVATALEDLHNLGALRQRANQSYAIAERYASASQESEAFQRTKTMDESIVTDLIRTLGGSASVNAVAKQLGVSYAKAASTLKHMQAAGLIQHRGKTRNSEYYLE